MSHVNGSRAYSRAEYLSDAAIHVLGIGFALIAGPRLWPSPRSASVTPRRSRAHDLCRDPSGDADLLGALQHDPAAALGGPSAAAGPIGDLFQDRGHLHALRRALSRIARLSGGGLGRGHRRCLADRVQRAAAHGVAIILYLGLGWAGYAARPAADRGAQRCGRGASGDGGLLYTGGIAFLLWNRLPFHNA
jgi:hemolysin III